MKRPVIFGAMAVGLLILIGWFAAAAISGGGNAPGTPSPTPDPDDVLQATRTYRGNADWTPVIEEFDGVEMVLVPAGCFQMGSTDEQIKALIRSCENQYGPENCAPSVAEAEGPQHLVCFSVPYWVDRYEVSQGQFEQFGGKAETAPEFPGDDLPRETIRWQEAQDYCEQRGARLPTEAEWEYAARGPDGWAYPWGDTFECSRGNFDDGIKVMGYGLEGGGDCDGFKTTSPVGSFPAGASWVGALDMGGNVWEWVSSIYQPYLHSETDGWESNSDIGSARVVRGGSWFSGGTGRAAARGFIYPGSIADGDRDLGFRCARSQ